MNIEQELLDLELKFNVPGTMLDRCLLPDKGIGWSLGIGALMAPKIFYTGLTIEDVITQAKTIGCKYGKANLLRGRMHSRYFIGI